MENNVDSGKQDLRYLMRMIRDLNSLCPTDKDPVKMVCDLLDDGDVYLNKGNNFVDTVVDIIESLDSDAIERFETSLTLQVEFLKLLEDDRLINVELLKLQPFVVVESVVDLSGSVPKRSKRSRRISMSWIEYNKKVLSSMWNGLSTVERKREFLDAVMAMLNQPIETVRDDASGQVGRVVSGDDAK